MTAEFAVDDRSDHVVVVGAGIVGERIGRLLGRPPLRRRADDELVEWAESALARSAGATASTVILATGGRHAPVTARLGRMGLSVVSVADSLDDVRELLELDRLFADAGCRLVVGAAMSPGVSGLLARHLAADLAVCDEIHTSFHATAGPACARHHHQALGDRSVGWHDGEWIERPGGSGRELCWFPEPVGARDCYRAALPEPLLLQRDFPSADRISARMSATRRDRLTAWLPMLRRPHPEGGVGAVRVEVRGADADGARHTLIAGIAEFVGAATAACAVEMARVVDAGAAPVGALTTSHPDLDHGAILAGIERHGIRLQEFTGVPQRA